MPRQSDRSAEAGRRASHHRFVKQPDWQRRSARVIMGLMMKRAALLLSAIGIAGSIAGADLARAEDAASPVVVELFTSQGCSSCPPADALLGELSKRKDVLALGFHVDYWDYIGWKDPYASKLATKRQRQYADSFKLSFVYTPQMVVNGVTESVGSDRKGIEAAVDKVKALAVPHPSLALERRSDGGLMVHVGAGDAKRPATVWLACFDRERSTVVPRGENAGSTLTNYHIVRHFESLGTWKGQILDLSVGPDVVAEYGGRPDQDMAVLVQTDGVGPILAAERLSKARQ